MEEVEGVQIFEEEVLPEKETAMAGGMNISVVTDEGEKEVESLYVPIKEESLVKMNREELKHQLRIRGLPLSGNKGDMLVRLRKGLDEKVGLLVKK